MCKITNDDCRGTMGVQTNGIHITHVQYSVMKDGVKGKSFQTQNMKEDDRKCYLSILYLMAGKKFMTLAREYLPLIYSNILF